MKLRRLLLPASLLLTPLLLPIAAVADEPGIKPLTPKTTATASASGSAAAPTTSKVKPPPAPTGKLAIGLEALDKSDYATAEKDLKAVTGADAAKATIGLARIAFDHGKYVEAESLARKAAGSASDPITKFDAIGWQGTALVAQGKLAEAKKVVEAARDEVNAPRARSVLVEVLVLTGDRDEAHNVANALEADSEGDEPVWQLPSSLACVGKAARLVRDIRYAGSTFKEAFKLQKKHVETNLEWAKLFLDYYDPGHAEESVRDALAVSPDNPWAHVVKAEVILAQNFDWDAADKELEAAAKINDKIPRAYFVKASMQLHDGDIKGADATADKGLAIDGNDLDLLSLKGAIRFLDDDRIGYQKAKDVVLKKNPQYSRFFIVVDEFAEWEHRYDDIVEMMKEATKVDPKDGKAWAELGFNLLRRGDEDEGRKALDTAYHFDKYNVRLVNVLNLFEKTLDKKFDLFEGTGTASVFHFRFDKEESDVLGRTMPRMLADAWARYVKKYGFTPVNPVTVEVYPERQHFSVRTDGVPNIGPTGVCFGRVITAVSPKKEANNWGLVLWHELGHVFAIQLSKSHVPRWFTEGLSEYETIIRRPEWHRALDPQLYVAVKSGRLPKVADMNHAFTHAKSTNDVITAYYASSQMIIYIAETYGFPKIVDMLRLWGEGKKNADVISLGLGVSSDALDAGFRAWLKKRLVRYDGQFMFDEDGVPEADDAKKASDAAPNDADKMATYAAALLLDRKVKDADATAQKAITLDGKNQLAHYVEAKIAFGLRHDPVETGKHVDAIVAAGGDGYVVENMRADLADANKDTKAFRTALEKAFKFDPSQADPLVDLWQLAVKEKRDGDALDLLRTMAPLDPHERVPWKKLMEELAKRSLWDELVKVGESAVFVDVYSPEVHALYARALTMKGAMKGARDEIDTGLATKPQPADEAMLRVEEARWLWRSNDAAKAREALKKALELDPKNDEGQKLKQQIG